MRKSILIIAICCVLSIYGCSSQAERGFVSSCKSDGVSGSACKCLYSGLEDHYGKEQLEKIMNQNVQGLPMSDAIPADFGDVMVQTAYKCKPYY